MILLLILIIYNLINSGEDIDAHSLKKPYDQNPLVTCIQSQECSFYPNGWEEELEKQISSLNRLISSNQGFLFDEKLRRSIWRLSDTIEELERQRIAPNDLLAKARTTLSHSLTYYQKMRQSHSEQLQKLEAEAKNINPYFSAIAALSQSDSQLANDAKLWGELSKKPSLHLDKHRCIVSAYAVLSIFYKKNGLGRDWRAFLAPPQLGVASLRKELKNNHDQGKLYYCEDPELDHVFLIQETPSGHYFLYQSFVNRYSLQAGLANSQILNEKEILAFLDELESLAESDIWTAEQEKTYKHLFLAPSPFRRRNKKKRSFRFQSASYQTPGIA